MRIKIQELIEELVSPLEENAISRFATGMDDAHVAELQERIKNMKLTRAKKEEMLEEIDELIDNSNRIFTQTNLLRTLASMPIYGVLGMVSAVTRVLNAKDRKAYREILHDMRHAVKSAKTVD